MDDRIAAALRLQKLPEVIGADLAVAGGILRCSGCGTEQPLGDVAHRLSHGWPKCCEYTMTWVTAKMLAWERRQPVPEGYQLLAVPDDCWRLVAGKRCRMSGSGIPGGRCPHPAVAELNRGALRGNERPPNWWAYCASHLYGRFIEDGQVMCLILKADSDA